MFALFYEIAEGACGHRFMLKLFQFRNVVRGIGGYLDLVFSRIGGFRFSMMMPRLGGRVSYEGFFIFTVGNYISYESEP